MSAAKQPEALRLADELLGGKSTYLEREAAAELRRQHEMNAELLEALMQMVEIAELTIGWFPTPEGADGPLIVARAVIAKATGAA